MPELIATIAPLAHGEAGGTAERWWDIGAVLAITALAAGYGRGVQELWSRGGAGTVVSRRQAASFAAGIGTLLLAQSPPVHELAEASFAGHMTQHMALLVIAAPLLALGGAGLPLTMALPLPWRRRVGALRAGRVARWLRRPAHRALLVGGLQTAVLWFWHLPAPYLAALQDPAVHAAEHATVLGAGWLLWSAVLGPDRHRLSGPVGFLLLFAAGMTAAALGAVLTLAPVPLYPDPALAPHGGDPLTDQQLAGLIMWIPMDVVLLALAVGVFRRWLASLDRLTPGDRDLAPPERAGEVRTP